MTVKLTIVRKYELRLKKMMICENDEFIPKLFSKKYIWNQMHKFMYVKEFDTRFKKLGMKFINFMYTKPMGLDSRNFSTKHPSLSKSFLRFLTDFWVSNNSSTFSIYCSKTMVTCESFSLNSITCFFIREFLSLRPSTEFSS